MRSCKYERARHDARRLGEARPMSRSTALASVLRPVDQSAAPPLHVAIIMDGNGRWAKQRGLPRALGHRAGVAALRRTVEGAEALGVERLTVFGFSTENWSRPDAGSLEILGLMKAYFASDLTRLERNRREGSRSSAAGRASREDILRHRRGGRDRAPPITPASTCRSRSATAVAPTSPTPARKFARLGRSRAGPPPDDLD